MVGIVRTRDGLKFKTCQYSAVTHPSSNRAQCRSTTLIETNMLPLHLHHAASMSCSLVVVRGLPWPPWNMAPWRRSVFQRADLHRIKSWDSWCCRSASTDACSCSARLYTDGVGEFSPVRAPSLHSLWSSCLPTSPPPLPRPTLSACGKAFSAMLSNGRLRSSIFTARQHSLLC